MGQQKCKPICLTGCVLTLSILLLSLAGCQNALEAAAVGDYSGNGKPAYTGQNENSAAASVIAQSVDAHDNEAAGSIKDNWLDTGLLIDRLDKESDETISYVYKDSPENITVGGIHEGNFTGSGKPELLVIFKLLKVPHAGGLDCSVAAVYDKSTLDIISQKTFPYDECKFSVLTDDAQKGFLLFAGSVTYQGSSQYTLELWESGRTWELLFPTTPAYSNNKKFDLQDNGIVQVSRPVYDTSGEQVYPEITWLHEYNLIWNKTTHGLEEIVPDTLKDTAGSPNVDAISVSPDGKYAISTFLDKSKVFIYDTGKNTLAADFELLAQDYGFLWSSDSSKVCITRTARIWKEISIIAVDTRQIIDFPSVAVIINTLQEKHGNLDYTLQNNRPDPYLTPIEWSPDNNELLVFYQWTDSNYNRQSGSFVFNVASGEISRLVQNPPEPEGGNLPVKKPEGFKW